MMTHKRDLSLPSWPIGAPSIEPLGRPMPGRPRHYITSATYIQLRADAPEHQLYFTTDGSDPDPFHRVYGNRSHTHAYKGPFKLKPGSRRTIKATAADRTNREESAVATKAFIVEDVSLALLREDDEESRVTLASEGESVLDELAYSSRSRKDPSLCTARSYRNGYSNGHLTDETVTEDEFLITPRSSILDDDSELEAYFESRLPQPTLQQQQVSRFDQQLVRRYDSGDSDGETEVANFFRSRSLSPSRSQRSRSRSHSRKRSGSRSRARSRSKSPRTLLDADGRLSPSTGISRYSPYDREVIRAEINRELLASDLDTARATGISGYTDGLPTQRTYSVSPTPLLHTPRSLQPKARFEADAIEGWKAREALDHQRVMNGHHSPAQGFQPWQPTSLDAGHSVRHSDPFFDRHKGHVGALRSSGPVVAAERYQHPAEKYQHPAEKYQHPAEKYQHPAEKYQHPAEKYQHPDVTVPPSVYQNGHHVPTPYEQGYNYGQLNGNATSGFGMDIATPKHHCSHGKSPRPGQFQVNPHHHSYDGRHATSHPAPAWEVGGKDPKEVTFVEEEKDKDTEKDDKKKKKEKEEKEEEEEKDKKKDAKKEKKDKKDKKNKKKKKKGKGSSSSSSSSSDSGSDSDSDKDSKKKKKKKKKEKKSSDKKSPPEPVSKSRVVSNSDGKMNFINDSGTQINYWGAGPDEVNRVINGVLHQQGGMTQSGNFYPTEMGPQGQSWGQSGLPQPPSYPQIAFDQSDDDESGAPFEDGRPKSGNPGTLSKSQQQEQQSIGGAIKGFFKKFTKGWGSNDKDKDKDPRSTIRDVDDVDKNKLSYEKIQTQCLKKGTQWEDPDFPANDKALYFSKKKSEKGVKWLRPGEICQDPQMFVGGASRFDIKQGVLGNCWLLAAVASLTTNKKLLTKVVPIDQSFQDKYAGVFRFRFWQYGRWVEVCVDDRLPTQNGKLMYMHSAENNEFWSPLLEKAYAKLCGTYESLAGGLSSEAMTDFTGGVVERYNFREELPDSLFQLMLKARERQSLMGCSIDASPGAMEEELDNGLIMGHAYSITDVKLLESSDGQVELVRVRNPWGNECEWNGPWSDESDEWQSLSEDDKKSLGLSFDHDGEFWMSYKDFSTHFQRLEICHLGPDALGEEQEGGSHWECQVLEGAWKKKVNAGGCRNYPETYWTNPQYRVTITDADDDDEEEIGTIIVGLMQKGRRKLMQYGEGNLTIGYDIYKIEESMSGTLDQKFFKRHRPSATAPAFINMREVCGRHRLPPGVYCIDPTTFEPNEEADFIVRVFSEKEGGLAEMDNNTSVVRAASTSEVHCAPPGRKSEAEKRFKQYGGEDLQIDAYELRDILNDIFKKDFEHASFDINLCRSIVALADADQTGKLGLEEFKVLWNELQTWQASFKEFDVDNNGYFNSYELRNALKSVGYQLSNATFNTVVMRYSNKEGCVQFDDYVACIVKLKSLFAIYGNCNKEGEEQANFGLDEFVQLTIYS